MSKSVTIKVTFEDGKLPKGLGFDMELLGGKVTAIAAYDLFSTMEIAEEALDGSSEEICVEAMKRINKNIVGGLNS